MNTCIVEIVTELNIAPRYQH